MRKYYGMSISERQPRILPESPDNNHSRKCFHGFCADISFIGKGTIIIYFANKCNRMPVMVEIYASGADSVPVIN